MASYSNYSRGVAILIRKGLHWKPYRVMEDREGRYLIVHGALFNTQVVIVNNYGPNTDSPSFYGQLKQILDQFENAAILWGGDFNVVLSTVADRQGATREHHPRAAEMLQGIIEELGLVDSWRELHPTVREGTCFTHHRNAWSRLDYWLTSRDLHAWVTDAIHHPRTFLDHAPTHPRLKIPNPYIQPFSWKFPSQALLDQVLHEDLRGKIEDYFTLNEGTVESPGTLWEAFKALVRGDCIALKTGVLKDIRNTLARLEKELKQLEQRQIVAPASAITAQIRQKLTEFQEEAERETKFLYKYAQARRYGGGDRPGKTLAALLRAPRGSSFITELETEEGTSVREPADIMHHMSRFYRELYTTQVQPTQSDITEYLNTIALIWFSKQDRSIMELPFTTDDIKQVINSMPANKAPGADGLTAAFYKEYVDITAPKLFQVYAEALETGILPPTLRESTIITLLKPDKDPKHPDSYRPLSPINLDAKIYAKLTANRLQPLLPMIALPDQSGFVPGRSTVHNLRTLFGLFHYLSPKVQAIAALLDATKAFD